MYKYSLDKSSKKFICPNCQKKTFVKYVSSEDNCYLEDKFGRCDRQSNCNYHLTPKHNSIILELPRQIFKQEASTLSNELIVKCGRNFKENNFVQFLRTHFTNEEVQSAILKYLLGTSNHWKGSTVFWQINTNNAIVAGKVMLYDTLSGKRIKKPYNHIHWVHKLLKINDFVLFQCLFGLHLVKEYKGEAIAIVESEKTAVMMSMFAPEYLWLATGSKTNLRSDLLEPIKNFKIIVFPDKSEFNDWSKKTSELKKNGFEIKCSRLIEDKEVENGYDLADHYLEKKATKVKNTSTEIEVKKLAQKNPEILSLIKTFDLVDKYFNDIINID